MSIDWAGMYVVGSNVELLLLFFVLDDVAIDCWLVDAITGDTGIGSILVDSNTVSSSSFVAEEDLLNNCTVFFYYPKTGLLKLCLTIKKIILL